MEKRNNYNPTFLIWDYEGQPHSENWTTILWHGFVEDNDSAISIPKLVEEQSDYLKSRYLEWIYELGETTINGKRLIDHLELRTGFSYWWMTLLAEKSYLKSPRLYDVSRLMALENLINEFHPQKIILACSDKKVAYVIKCFCRETGIVFEFKQSRLKNREISLIKRIYDSLPHSIQAILYLLRYLSQHWALRHSVVDETKSFTGEITFVDYLLNLDRKAASEGRFASNYWTELINVVHQSKTSVNWIHHFMKHDFVQKAKDSRALINQFNENSDGLEHHVIFDCALNYSLILNVLSDYNNLSKRKADIKSIKNSFRIKNSKIDLWPLLKNDWQNSLKGKISMSNCLTINLIEGTLSKLPPQKLGVYLQENISWEMAFIHIWKALGHGYLIGVPHSTVRFGDYRFYYDSRSYFNNGNNNLPLPDKVALNGPVAMKAYHDGNYPEEKMIEVEALRYLHLEEKNSCKNKNIDTFKLSSDLCVLVCGDYMPKVSKQIMLWLESAVKELPPNVHYIVKPHPSCPIMANDYPSLNLEMTNAPLVELLPKCDVVFTSNGTAAAVEAYCSGIPVIQVLDGNTFNLSPLHGLKGVEYVTNPMELAEVLQNVRKLDGVIIEPYFCLDNDLPRWKKLLDLIDL